MSHLKVVSEILTFEIVAKKPFARLFSNEGPAGPHFGPLNLHSPTDHPFENSLKTGYCQLSQKHKLSDTILSHSSVTILYV